MTSDVVDSGRDALRATHVRASRRFTNAAGESVRITVNVARLRQGGPVVVASRQAMPLGDAYRYRAHVEPLDVWGVSRDWLGTLSEDYCAQPECSDLRRMEWRRLTQKLARVPCIEVGTK